MKQHILFVQHFFSNFVHIQTEYGDASASAIVYDRHVDHLPLPHQQHHHRDEERQRDEHQGQEDLQEQSVMHQFVECSRG